MKLKKFILAGVALMPLLFAHPAQANDYCREFQKTIRVGGRLQEGYGTACMQPDGSWMIVNSDGNVDPFDDLRQQNVMIVSDQYPVHYVYGPAFRPVVYYPRPYYYHHEYYRPYTTSFFFNFGGGDRHWDRDHDRGWDHDRDDDHGHWDNGWHGHH